MSITFDEQRATETRTTARAIDELVALAQEHELPSVTQWTIETRLFPAVGGREVTTVVAWLCPEAGYQGAEDWARHLDEVLRRDVRHKDVAEDGTVIGELWIYGRYKGAYVAVRSNFPPKPVCDAEFIDGRFFPCHNPECLDCAAEMEQRRG